MEKKKIHKNREVHLGSILEKFYTCNLQVRLLFLARETTATLVKYKCKTFTTLTPGLTKGLPASACAI